jgi:hypothetical protein
MQRYAKDSNSSSLTAWPYNTISLRSLPSSRLRNPRPKPGESPKLMYRWSGPWRVVERLSDVTYRIASLSDNNTLVAHVKKLSRFYPYEDPYGHYNHGVAAPPAMEGQPHVAGPAEPPAVAGPPPLPALQPPQPPVVAPPAAAPTQSASVPSVVNRRPAAADRRARQPSPQRYQVQALLQRRGRGPSREYLVHWEGYPANEATWEPLRHLLPDYRDEVRVFDRSIGRKQKAAKASR